MNKRLLFNFAILLSMAAVGAAPFLVPANLNNVYYAIIRPAAYMILLALTLVFIGVDFGYSKSKKTALSVLLFGSLVYVALLFIAGLISGLGRNPMSVAFGVVMSNVWRYVPFVVIGELLRFQLVRNSPKKHKTLMLAAVILVFSFTMLDNLGGLKGASAARILEFVMTGLLPVLVVNFFLTYICGSASLIGTTCFRAAYSLLPIFLPYLPGITKIFLAIILYVSVIVMFFLYDKYVFDQNKKAATVSGRYKWSWYLIPMVILALFLVVWSGILPAGPVAVASESMTGTFNKGDLVIVRRLSEEEAATVLKEGDIIQFRGDRMDVIHRIVSVTTDHRGEVQYVTKGDFNEKADDVPVSTSQIIGVVSNFRIPYLGYPSVLLSEMMKK